MWKYMNREINPSDLPSKDELLSRIRKGGGTDSALADLCDEQIEFDIYDLVWRYPISVGMAAGGVVMPVREGILWIPYDEMECEDGEIFLLEGACLLDADACSYMADDFQSYAEGLCSMLREAAVICEQLHNSTNETEEYE